MPNPRHNPAADPHQPRAVRARRARLPPAPGSVSPVDSLAVGRGVRGGGRVDRPRGGDRADRTIYEAGPVAPPHQFFENNCPACHTTWAPATRFRVVAGDSRPRAPPSTTRACQHCHAGSPHYEGQGPAARRPRLRRVPSRASRRPDAHCRRQRRSASSATALDQRRSAPPSPSAAWPTTTITSFAADHPEFDALAQPDLPRRARVQSPRPPAARVRQGRQAGEGHPGTSTASWKTSRKNCTACHQPDAEKRYMLPINYAQHCQRCHPLYFDNENFPGEVVPHGVDDGRRCAASSSRRYTALALAGRRAGRPRSRPSRPLPGRAPDDEPAHRRKAAAACAKTPPPRTSGSSRPIAETEEAARDAALRREQVLFGPEALGGCRLCHEVSRHRAGEPDRRGFPAEWEIVHPQIPHAVDGPQPLLARQPPLRRLHGLPPRFASYNPPRARADSDRHQRRAHAVDRRLPFVPRRRTPAR